MGAFQADALDVGSHVVDRTTGASIDALALAQDVFDYWKRLLGASP